MRPLSPRSIDPERQEPRKLRLILNHRAAQDMLVRDAVTTLRGAGHLVEVRVIWEGGQAETFAEEAALAGCDAAIAFGGDGTVYSVANGILKAGEKSHCALGVVPFGTANDFASSLGLTADDPVATLRLLANCPPQRIDVGRVAGRYFVNVASAGYGAEVTHATSSDMKQFLGGFAYFLTGLTSVSDLSARHVRLSGPGFKWEGSVLGLTIGNARQAGGGYVVAPRARLDDGLFDVMIIPEVGWTALLNLVNDLMTLSDPTNYQQITYRQLSWLKVEGAEEMSLNLDGEQMTGKAFHFEILPRRLPCLIPPGCTLVGAPRAAQASR